MSTPTSVSIPPSTAELPSPHWGSLFPLLFFELFRRALTQILLVSYERVLAKLIPICFVGLNWPSPSKPNNNPLFPLWLLFSFR